MYSYDQYNYYSPYNSYRNDSEIISLNDAIELIKTSVGNEKEDVVFYDKLINLTSDSNDKKIIESIRNDEIKHNNILRSIYTKLTNNSLPSDAYNGNNNNMSYKDMLVEALMGELEAVKRYRRIMGAMKDAESYTYLMSIMTDELRHANLYNYLISKQK